MRFNAGHALSLEKLLEVIPTDARRATREGLESIDPERIVALWNSYPEKQDAIADTLLAELRTLASDVQKSSIVNRSERQQTLRDFLQQLRTIFIKLETSSSSLYLELLNGISKYSRLV